MHCSKEFVVALGVLMAATGFGENRLNVNSPDPVWWFQDRANWTAGDFPSASETDVYLGADTAGAVANVFLKDADRVVLNGNLTLGYASSTVTALTVDKGASLAVNYLYVNPKTARNYTTNTLDVAGGRVTVGAVSIGRNNTRHTVKVRNGGVLSYTGGAFHGHGAGVRVCIDGGTLTDSGYYGMGDTTSYPELEMRNGAKLEASYLSLAANVDGQSLRASIVDSSVYVTNSVTYGRKSSPSIVLTNSTWLSGTATSQFFNFGSANESLYDSKECPCFEIGPRSKFTTKAGFKMLFNAYLKIVDADVCLSQSVHADHKAIWSFGTSGAAVTQTVDMVSGTFVTTSEVATAAGKHANARIFAGSASYGKFQFIQRGGTVRCPGVCFGSKDLAYSPRYDIYGGVLDINEAATTSGGLSLDATAGVIRGGIFSIHGGAPEVIACRVGKSHSNLQPLMEYVMMTNGVAPIKSLNRSSRSGINGFYDIVADGGLQVMRGDAVRLQEFEGAQSISIETEYNGKIVTKFPNADLWKTAMTGLDATGTNTLASTLNAEAEIVSGIALAEPRHYGWVRLPRGKRETVKKVSVLLKLVPQGNETAATLAAGLTAAGYSATVVADGEYNVRADIPVALLPERIENGRLLLDFHRCEHSEDFRDDTYAVRAKIAGAKVEKQGAGLMLLLK